MTCHIIMNSHNREGMLEKAVMIGSIELLDQS